MENERLSDSEFQQYLMQHYHLSEAQAQRVVDLRNSKPENLSPEFIGYMLSALAQVAEQHEDLDLVARMLCVAISYAHRDGRPLTMCPVEYTLLLRDGIIVNPN